MSGDKVYLVFWPDYDGVVVYGLFSTREKAEEYVSGQEDNLFIEEYIVDKGMR